MNSKKNNLITGKQAEDKAFLFLKQNGLKPLDRNYRAPVGEIDLIMKDDDIIVFIEVRARTSNHMVSALETIDKHKCSRIIQTSQHYLQKHATNKRSICRFDVVLFSGPLESAKVEWIKNAFEA